MNRVKTVFAQVYVKRDGRTLDHETLKEMQRLTVQKVREGEKPAAGRGRGLEALRSTRGGRPRSLTPAQERQVFRWVNGRDLRQYGLDFGLWARRIVAMLIEQKLDIRLGVTAVGAHRGPNCLLSCSRR